MKVSVSFLSCDDYKDAVRKIDASTADYIHCDLADGKYVKTKNFTTMSAVNLLKDCHKKLDIHLMTVNPEKYIDSLSILNVDAITFHPSTTKNPKLLIEYIQNLGIKAGIAINPKEPLEMFEELFKVVDHVLIMSVIPGKGGQPFIESTINKLKNLITYKEKYHFTTTVDGAINEDTILKVKDLELDYVVSGSFVTSSDDYDKQISLLR